MADAVVPISAGTGTNISTRTNASSEHMQVVMLGIDGSDTVVPATASGLSVVSDDVALTSVPPADALTDSIAAFQGNGTVIIQSGDTFTACTYKVAFANIAASQTDGNIVTGVTSKKIRVLRFGLHAGPTATDFTFCSKPGGAHTVISEKFALGANGGHEATAPPSGFLFETAAGEALTGLTGTGATTGVSVGYIEVA